jgi:Na+-translocating ferredoxin:NAD+ oxidoreductase subunit G
MSESIYRHAINTASYLIGFAVIGTAILAYTFTTTEAPIAVAEAKVRMALFGQLLPTDLFDNDLLNDTVDLKVGELGNTEVTKLYRARLNGQPSAVILQATAPDGYSGEIKLLIAIKANGELSGVRVLAHKETPGLGDYIDIQHGDWILNFNGLSLANTNQDGWRVKKDGGRFDYVTGATITPRAVVKAVNKALTYFSQHQDTIFAKSLPATQTVKEAQS